MYKMKTCSTGPYCFSHYATHTFFLCFPGFKNYFLVILSLKYLCVYMRRKQQQQWHDGAGLRSSLANTPYRNTTSRQSGIYDACILTNPRVFLLTRHTHSQGTSCYFTNITFPEMTPSLSAPSAHLFGQAAVCWVWIWGAASLKGPLQIGCIYIFRGTVMFSAMDAKAACDVFLCCLFI